MIPLPLERVDDFARSLELTWWNRSGLWTKRREALIIGLGLCSARYVETTRLLRSDVSMRDGIVHIRSAKGGRKRRVPVGLSWCSGVAELWREVVPRGEALKDGRAFYTRSGGPVCYEQVRRRLAAWTKKTFGRSYSFHCLRHTAALRRYLETRDVLAVQLLLGHRSLRCTQEYLATLMEVGDDGLPSFARETGLRVFDPDGLAGGGGLRVVVPHGREAELGRFDRRAEGRKAAKRAAGSSLAEGVPATKRDAGQVAGVKKGSARSGDGAKKGLERADPGPGDADVTARESRASRSESEVSSVSSGVARRQAPLRCGCSLRGKGRILLIERPEVRSSDGMAVLKTYCRVCGKYFGCRPDPERVEHNKSRGLRSR